MAGVILGPSILGRIRGFDEKLFPISGDLFLNYLCRMGFIFFIFLWGVKMDPKMMFKTGRSGWIIGVTATLLPSISGLILLKHFQESSHIGKLKTIIYAISTHSYISFPVVASVLVHLKIINTELGHLALSSGLITNLTNILLNIMMYAVRQIGWFSVLQYLGAHCVLLLLISIIVRPLSHWIIKQTGGSKPVKRLFVIIMWIVLLATVILADHIGVPHEVAAFLLGLIGVPDGPPLGSSLVKKLENLVDGLLAPLMVSYCGTKVDLVHLSDLKHIRTLWILVGCCLVIKVVSLLLPALVVKVPPRDMFTLAFIMSSQGIVQISSHLFLLNVEVYNGEDFSMMVLAVLLVAAIMNTLAKSTYDYSYCYTGYRKRTIQHEGVNGELKILPCIYRLDDVFPMRKLLEVSMPDEESPVSVSVMHLGELVGRASPQLIDHKFSQKEIHSSSIPRSQELLEYFVDFEHKNAGLVRVQFFSAISMFRFMHQDICSLAFRQSVSLIILPFHRKWNHQGKVILENNNLRAVNSNVLNMPPCSVGILVDRQKVHQSSSHTTPSSCNVCVIFIGGLDDIEALSYGKRMARSPGVHLTVVQFLAETNAPHNDWDNILDAEALRELKVAYNNYVVYKKEVVKHGAETAAIVHKLEESCDLILVGRRHKENLTQLYGLTEWNEFPELGPLGDIMAISEIHKPHSVLVVQQQAIKQT